MASFPLAAFCFSHSHEKFSSQSGGCGHLLISVSGSQKLTGSSETPGWRACSEGTRGPHGLSPGDPPRSVSAGVSSSASEHVTKRPLPCTQSPRGLRPSEGTGGGRGHTDQHRCQAAPFLGGHFAPPFFQGLGKASLAHQLQTVMPKSSAGHRKCRLMLGGTGGQTLCPSREALPSPTPLPPLWSSWPLGS